MDALIAQLATLGVGGLIAAVVLVWKRQDDIKNDKTLAELNAAHIKAMEVMFARMELRDKSSTEVIQANTAALVGLQASIAQLNALKQLIDRIEELERARRREKPN